MTRRWRWVVLAVVVAGAGYIGYRAWSQRRGAVTAGGDTVVVRRDTFEKTISSTGNLAPLTETALTFGSAGTVAEVRVAVGDVVTKGQVLASLDTRELALDVASAEASLGSAQTGLASARQSLDDLLAGPDENTVAKARIEVDQAKDRRWAVQSQRDSTCGRLLHGGGDQGGLEASCNSAESSVRQAESAVTLAEMNLAEVMAGATEAELAAARDKVAAAEAQVAAAQNQLAQARLRLSQATLVAPMDGTVTALGVSAGQAVGAAEAAVTVSDLATLQVVVSVSESDVIDMAVGQAALITADAFPDAELTGQVSSVAPVGTAQSGVVLFPVTVTVDPADVPVRSGMTVEVAIVTASVANALVVPLRAVTTTARGSYVTRLVRSTGAGAGDGASGDVPAAATAVTMGRRRDGTAGPVARGTPWPFPGGTPGELAFPMGTPGAFPRGRTGTFGQGSAALGATTTNGATEQVAVSVGPSNDTEVVITDGVAEGDVLVVTTTARRTDTTADNMRLGGPGMGVFIDRPMGP